MKKVLIMIDTSRATGRELLLGVERYISAFTDWQINTLSPDYLSDNKKSEPAKVELNDFDGLFVCQTVNIARILKVRIPKVIHYTPKEIIPKVSLIKTDSEKIGAMAADYFASLGFKNFAYCGFKNITWSNERLASYEHALKKLGFDLVNRYINTPTGNREADRGRLVRWLSKLTTPSAVLACNDDRAVYILEACRACGLNVPEDIAVLGVDNDRLVCNLSSPPLSSIAMNFSSAGFEAARHLDKLMTKKAEDITIEVTPSGIVTRKSTDIFAVEDKEVIAALVYIRNNYLKPIQVSDVIKATTVSRRELEYRFRRELSLTIKEQIEKLRIENIKRMLLNSREPIYKIADELSFTDPEHFSRYFRNQTGISPSKFRQNTTPLT